MSTDGKYLINNNGTQRIIAVFAPSFVLGLVGFLEIIKTKWLRMFFKFCGMPVVAVFSIFMICGYLANSGLAPKTTSNTNANVASKNTEKRQTESVVPLHEVTKMPRHLLKEKWIKLWQI